MICRWAVLWSWLLYQQARTCLAGGPSVNIETDQAFKSEVLDSPRVYAVYFRRNVKQCEAFDSTW
jgi:hypothetical protein